MTELDRECDECKRFLIETGAILAVEAARGPQKASQVVDELKRLRDARSPAKKRRYADLVERFKSLASYGKLESPREMRWIEDETWEIKTSEDRIPFYWKDATERHMKAVRLTHQFEKRFGKTSEGKMPRRQKDHAAWLIRKDREHDN